MNLRAKASQVLFQVIAEGRSLSDCLSQTLSTDARDQAFIQAVCYGVCRWYDRLDAILQILLEKPLKEKDQDVECLLLVGLFQLTDMRVPAHAAVAETVAATKQLKKIWAKNLVNAVLRNYQRRANEINEIIQKNPQAVYSHPSWMIEKIKTAWPVEWEAILTANNQHPPFALRVNQKKITREKYLSQLQNARAIPETTAGIVLEQAIDVEKLPGFSEGFISVQDGAAQLAAELLDLQPGQRVLDACAAPGGKTTHILEQGVNIDLIALDQDETRLQTIRDNLNRLQLSATCVCSDAGEASQWWDGKPFDRILLDVPCSASGVIRRHPDIKILRRAEDIAKLVVEQKRLLNAMWPLLKPGGMLVYATCSIFPEENSDILQTFLAEHHDAREQEIVSDWGKISPVGKQILPGTHDMDGFYYARLIKLK